MGAVLFDRRNTPDKRSTFQPAFPVKIAVVILRVGQHMEAQHDLATRPNSKQCRDISLHEIAKQKSARFLTKLASACPD